MRIRGIACDRCGEVIVTMSAGEVRKHEKPFSVKDTRGKKNVLCDACSAALVHFLNGDDIKGITKPAA